MVAPTRRPGVGRSTRALLLLLAGGVAPLRAQAPDARIAPSGPCTNVVGGAGQPQAHEIAWSSRTNGRERQALDRHCGTLGSIVLLPTPAAVRPLSADSIVVVGWNVHVGGGDLLTVLDRLESGGLTGAPVPHYVLLIQEAHRSGGDVPAVAPGVDVPRRIAPRAANRVREDIVTIARRRGLALYYVASMRNGDDAPFEDRGNAILSTLPLDGLAAVELPFTRQRRVAIGARIEGRTSDGRPWSVQLASVHLDTLAGPSRLWIFAAGWRGAQAKTAIAGLGERAPSVVSGDLNTWLLGGWESAVRRFRHSYPQTRTAVTPPGAAAHGRLDYVFYRLPEPWRSEIRKLREKFGSDHAPLVGAIRFAP
jgi:endonuclease/exonuclease/phosphatase family metal-dependent hydrolase